MKTWTVFRKFVLVYLLFHVGTAMLFLLFSSTWVAQQFKQQRFERLNALATLIRNQIPKTCPTLEEPELQGQIEMLAKGLSLRITIIADDGRVLADTERSSEPFENHSNRPEVIQARHEPYGTATRFSESVNREMSYLAVRLDDENTGTILGFVRVAADQSNFLAIQRTLIRVLWAFGLLVTFLSTFFMWRYTQKEMEPLADFSQAARAIALGQFEPTPLALNRQDEWRTLADAFRQMQTELAHREQRLIENTQRLEAVLSSMIEGVLAIDATGSVILANEAACQMLEVDLSQLLGRKLLEVVRIPLLRQAIEEVQIRRTSSRIEFQTFTEPRKTIGTRLCVMADAPIPGVALVLHDLTELRQLENLRRDFVANVSHELRTPLSSIKAYAETLKMGAMNDQSKGPFFLHQIETQADLLNQQIQDLITLGKVESGQTVFNIASFEVNEVCQQVMSSFRESAAAKGIDLRYEERDPGLLVRADYDETLTIINNLVSNSLRYTPAQGQVTIRTFAESRRAVIQVSDTGIGIAPEFQARVFERFFRVDKARSRELGGTGLGLSIVKHLTQSMGGSVHLESRLGAGCTFSIKLPKGAEA